MTYSMVTMRKALQELGFASDTRGFVWEAEAGRVHDGLSQQFAIEYEKGLVPLCQG